MKDTRHVLQRTTTDGAPGFLSFWRGYTVFLGPIMRIMVTDVRVLLSNTFAESVRCRCNGSLCAAYFSRSHREHQSRSDNTIAHRLTFIRLAMRSC